MSAFRALRPRSRRDTDPDERPIKVRACRDVCVWNRTPAERRGEPLFACRGCGSQWVPSEDWTPRNREGSIPDEILEIVRGRD